MYFLRRQSDGADAFEILWQTFANMIESTPSMVVVVCSDDGGEFRDGNFGSLSRQRGITQEFSFRDNPQFNGVAERTLGLIEVAAHATRIQAVALYPTTQLPTTASLWAEA